MSIDTPAETGLHPGRPSAEALRLAFTPSAPIRLATHLAGRSAQIGQILDAIAQEGQHLIIFGDRGTGKTSVVAVLPELLGAERLITARITCDSTDTYASLWRKVASDLEQKGYDYLTKGTVLQALPLTEAVPDITPGAVRAFLARLGRIHETIVIMDEFDRLTDGRQKLLFADTIKALSDYRVPATLILVGVADDIDDLLRGHRSVERALTQVRMPRMAPDELAEIVSRGLHSAGLSIDAPSLAALTRLARGLPHYVHLLAQSAARAALDEDRALVQLPDVHLAVRRVLERIPESVSDPYEAAVTRAPGGLLPRVLLACALARMDRVGSFAAEDLEEPFARLAGRSYRIPPFVRHLNALASQEDEPILRKAGPKRRPRFQFIDALLEPYILMRGLASGEIDYAVFQAERAPTGT